MRKTLIALLVTACTDNLEDSGKTKNFPKYSVICLPENPSTKDNITCRAYIQDSESSVTRQLYDNETNVSDSFIIGVNSNGEPTNPNHTFFSDDNELPEDYTGPIQTTIDHSLTNSGDIITAQLTGFRVAEHDTWDLHNPREILASTSFYIK